MPSATPVREVMSTEVVTLAPEESFEVAADTLAQHRIGAAPVLDEAGKVIGLLRDEDLILSEANLHAPTAISILGAEIVLPGEQKRFERELKRMVAAQVKDLMVTEFDTCAPDDTVGDVATRMHDADITHMPVLDGDQLVGIIARGDIVRRVADTT